MAPELSAAAWVMLAGRGQTRHQQRIAADTEKTLAVDVYAVVHPQRDAEAHHLWVD
jgi:hypothetical protein